MTASFDRRPSFFLCRVVLVWMNMRGIYFLTANGEKCLAGEDGRFTFRVFWLDEAEPEYSVYDFDNYRYYRGTDLEIGNIYPVEYAKTFYEGMEREGQENIVNLLRCRVCN